MILIVISLPIDGHKVFNDKSNHLARFFLLYNKLQLCTIYNKYCMTSFYGFLTAFSWFKLSIDVQVEMLAISVLV